MVVIGCMTPVNTCSMLLYNKSTRGQESYTFSNVLCSEQLQCVSQDKNDVYCSQVAKYVDMQIQRGPVCLYCVFNTFYEAFPLKKNSFLMNNFLDL